jgi:dolichyl-phosphate-mannose-protein mannosyltransferase
MKNRTALTAIGIGVVGLSLFLRGIGNPSLFVFDESMYVIGARAILGGTEDTNPEHPPLAKFLIAAAMKIAGDNPFGWRLAGAILGALTLVAIFLWTYLLLRDYRMALTAAGLTLFNNFLFVMSRVAMLDVFYFSFVIWAVLAFTAALLLDVSLRRRRLLLAASGVLFGLGTACKWSAVVTLAAVGLLAAIFYLRNSHHVRDIGATALAATLILAPVATYALSYWPLCYRFHEPFTVAQLVVMNRYIWRYHVLCPGNPALDVRWYRWFFRASPERGLSYLMGNFVVVWLGLLALVLCGWRFLRSLLLRSPGESWLAGSSPIASGFLAEGLVTLFYAVNLLQWVIIPQKRLVYYYYYPSAMFLGVALAIVISRAHSPRLFGVRVSVLLLVLSAVFFAYCYPRMAALESPYDCMFGCWV